jgi:hypothetical protein
VSGSALLAWALLLTWLGALLHVLVSPRGGPFLPPSGSRCPLGPRTGWVVLVLLLGPLGWILYMRRRVSA